MENEHPKQNLAESAEEQAVSDLLSTLQRVQAPGDFEFRVRAGIAAGKPAGGRASWLPAAARLAVPLLLIVLVGAYFGTGLFSPTQTIETPLVADTAPAAQPPVSQQALAPPVAAPPVGLVADNEPLKPVEASNRFITPSVQKRNVRTVRAEDDITGGGSFDEASSESRKIFPRGVAPAQTPPANANIAGSEGSIQVRDILGFIGINARYTALGWTVESVKANNMADRSGVKASDVIEAINDQAISEKTAFGNKFTGKSLRVRRDGKIIEIKLGR